MEEEEKMRENPEYKSMKNMNGNVPPMPMDGSPFVTQYPSYNSTAFLNATIEPDTNETPTSDSSTDSP